MAVPTHLEMTVVAQDPAVAKSNGSVLTSTVVLPYEDLDPGPCGARVQIVDYDSSTKTFYAPFDFVNSSRMYRKPKKPAIVGDPHFHSQNVFAIAMQTLRRFELALGRPVPWSASGHQLKIAPHAFSEPNAFYSRSAEALLFGYFQGHEGDTIYSCLSHDVIVHETTHALLDGLRERFTGPSLPDQAAFHEGLADVVALLSVLSQEELIDHTLDLLTSQVVEELLDGRAPGADLKDMSVEKPGKLGRLIPREALSSTRFKESLLFGLALEMGAELSNVRGQPLRNSLDLTPSRDYLEAEEFRAPHRRGEILVAAVMHTYLEVWTERLRDMTGDGDVSRRWATEEAAAIAENLLTLVIRALDYTAPVHLEFQDYLSALLTADHEARPGDGRYKFQAHLLAMFARYGIYPRGDTANDGRWARTDEGDYDFGRVRLESLQRDPDEAFKFVWNNRKALDLEHLAHTRVQSVRPCYRVAPEDGFAVRETVVEVVQLLKLRGSELYRVTGLKLPKSFDRALEIPLQGGATLVFNDLGRLKYVIKKPLSTRRTGVHQESAQNRIDRLVELEWFGAKRRRTSSHAELHLRRARRTNPDHALAYEQQRWN